MGNVSGGRAATLEAFFDWRRARAPQIVEGQPSVERRRGVATLAAADRLGERCRLGMCASPVT